MQHAQRKCEIIALTFTNSVYVRKTLIYTVTLFNLCIFLCTPLLITSSYAAVTKCWEEIPDNRPNFSKLVITFSSCLEDIAGYIDFSPDPFTKEFLISGYDHLTPTRPQSRGVHTGYDHLNPTIVISDTTLDGNITDPNIS